MIYYGKQSISQKDIDAVVSVLKSELITQGPVTQVFETAICEYTGAKYAVACSHGTAALHLACLALGLGPGDNVWTSPNSFVASANCALYCGAEIDFVDIDCRTLNMSVHSLSKKLEQAKKKNALPKAIIAVHFAGNPCDMADIKRLSEKYSFLIIEDACHALGASYKTNKIGSCIYSDITIFSFHPVKSITCGEGGMLLTNSKLYEQKARLYASHGITRDSGLLENQYEGEWYYEQKVLGFNYRITDIQSALGISQLKRLHEFIEKRKAIAEYYSESLSGLPVSIQTITNDSNSAYHLFSIMMNRDFIDRKAEIYDQMKESGVVLNCHYIPIHLQPFYRQKGFKEGDFPNAEYYYQSCFSIPIYPDLDDSDRQKVVELIKQVFK